MRRTLATPPARSHWHGALNKAAQFVDHKHDLLLPWHGFAAHYAKAKGGKKGGRQRPAAPAEDDAADGAQQDPGFELEAFEQLMERSVEHLAHELAGVRTGRANPGLLENIPVDAYGAHQPLKACGTVTVRSPQLLVVSLFDPQLVPAVIKAVQASPLGITPGNEGGELHVRLPRMTQEATQAMVRMVHMEAEEAHTSIRRARQKAMDAARRAFEGGSIDERRAAEKAVQQLHDKWIAEVDRMKKLKETELREHRD